MSAPSPISRDFAGLLQAIMEASADLIAALDTNFQYIAFNRAYQQEFELVFGRKLAIGSSMVDELAHLPDDQAKAVAVWGRALAGETFVVSDDYGDEAGVRNTYEMRFTPIFDEQGRITGACEMSRDVTAMRRSQQLEFEASLARAGQQRSEASLRDAEERLRLAVESAEIGTFDWNLVTGDLEWSPRSRQMFEVEADTPVTVELFLERIHPEDRDRLCAMTSQLLNRESRSHFDVEYRCLLPSGAIRNIVATGRVYFGEDGSGPKATRFVGTMLDLSSQRQAQEALRQSEASLQQMTEAIPQLVWSCDSEGGNQYHSKRWFAYTGAGRPESGEWPWQSYLHPDDREALEFAWQEARRAQSTFEHEFRLRRHDGAYRWHLSRAEPIRGTDGAVARWFGTCTDIDDQKRAEQALRRTNEALNHFAYAASHDLQEPLRMVSTYAQLLIRSYKGQLDDNADQFAKFIVDGSNRMSVLLRDLLEYAETSRELEPAPAALADTNAAFQTALSNLGPAIQESGATITCEPLAQVACHYTHLVQLFQNLIGNSIKYRRSEPLRIHVGCARQNNFWRISVQDNGIGIAPEYQEKVFGIFKRLHGREIAGTGIGLAICQKTVERYGGRIWAESTPGRGATFFFTLP